jgi:hypothetical protein
MKSGSDLVEDHTWLNHNRHPVDGALVGASSLWPMKFLSTLCQWNLFGGANCLLGQGYHYVSKEKKKIQFHGNCLGGGCTSQKSSYICV